MSIKHALLAYATNTLTPLSDSAISKYDWVLTQFDRGSRIAGVKALNSAQKWLVYQNTILVNNLGSTGVPKSQADLNTGWYLKSMLTEPYYDSVIRDTPPHFWMLQETSGTVADDNVGSTDGTYNASDHHLNQASLTGNAALKSVGFDGFGFYGVPTTLAILGSQNYTFEGWAYRSNNTFGNSLFGSSGSSKRINLRILAGTNDVRWWSDTTSGSVANWFGAAPAPGTNFHWALTWNASTKTAELFINGISKGTQTITPGIDSATVGNFVIGSWHSDLIHDTWLGRLSHIAVWTSILDGSRILAHATNGPNTTTGGGAIVESQYFSGNYICDPGNTGYQTAWATNVNTVMGSYAWDGVAGDDVDYSVYFHSPVTLGDPDNPYSGLTDAKFRDRMRLFMVNVRPMLTPGKIFFANISNNTSRAVWDDWVSLVDGASREFWKKYSNGDSSAITPVQPASGNSRFIDGDYDVDSGYLPPIEGIGKFMIPITYGVASDVKIQRYGYAAFLLEWNGTSDSAWAFSLDTNTADPYSVYWFKDIGLPTGAKYNVLSDSNCWMRNYTKGFVAVNASASSKVFDLSAYPSLLKADGSAAGTSLTIPAGEAEILSFVVGADTGTSAQTAAMSAAIPGTDVGSSSQVGAISGLAPVNAVLPAITGTAQATVPLTSTTGIWNFYPVSYAYQWYRCDAGGGSCVVIPGATSSVYDVSAVDVGYTIRVRVTATNPFGSTAIDSQPTALVIAAPAPTIPDEVPATEAELSFIDESPPGFFPENQGSNFGIKRKVFTDQVQDAANDQSEIYTERFVATSDIYLDEWEKMMGLPYSPALDTGVRRARIIGRLRQGPFTREARKELIEKYIQATFGVVPFFTPSGIPISAGIPLHAAAGIVAQLYRIYERVDLFQYNIWIDSTVGIDLVGLTRELDFLTPSGISYNIDQAHTGTGLIDWQRSVFNYAPSGWWQLDTYVDSSGNLNTGTVTGAPSAVASPGLLLCAPGVTNGAKDFSGSGQYVTIPDAANLNSPAFTLQAIVRPDTLPSLAPGNYRSIYQSGNDARSPFLGIASSASTIRFVFRIGDKTSGVTYEIIGNTIVSISSVYRVFATFDGATAKLFVNGVLDGQMDVPAYTPPSGQKLIGNHSSLATPLWDGVIDEVAVYGYPLADDDVVFLSKQAANTL